MIRLVLILLPTERIIHTHTQSLPTTFYAHRGWFKILLFYISFSRPLLFPFSFIYISFFLKHVTRLVEKRDASAHIYPNTFTNLILYDRHYNMTYIDFNQFSLIIIYLLFYIHSFLIHQHATLSITHFFF